MIDVRYADGGFQVKGTFSLGLAGTAVNETFTVDGDITIDDDLEYIWEELQKESLFYQPLFPYLKGKEDGPAVAQGLADYYNQKEREIQANIKQINDCFLYHLFEDLEGCEYPFWEIKESIVPGSLDGVDLEEIYHQEESVSDLWEDFYERPNNGTILKRDVEALVRRIYPMFDLDSLYRSIVPQGIFLSGKYLEVQFSDGWGGDLLCGAYDRLDENFTSCDWHNH